MSQCRSLPSKLYYFGAREGQGSIRAANPHKALNLNHQLLCLDLIKAHLQDRGDGPFISLFSTLASLKEYHRSKMSGFNGTARFDLCEIDSSRLSGTRTYKTSDNIKGMGSAAKGPLPDYLASAEIPGNAIRVLPRNLLQ